MDLYWAQGISIETLQNYEQNGWVAWAFDYKKTINSKTEQPSREALNVVLKNFYVSKLEEITFEFVRRLYWHAVKDFMILLHWNDTMRTSAEEGLSKFFTNLKWATSCFWTKLAQDEHRTRLSWFESVCFRSLKLSAWSLKVYLVEYITRSSRFTALVLCRQKLHL